MTPYVGSPPATILVEYDPIRVMGRLTLSGAPKSAIWERITNRAINEPEGSQLTENSLNLPWSAVLGILNDYGSRQQQEQFDFRFKLSGEAQTLARRFAEEVRRAKAARTDIALALTEAEVIERLAHAGFVKLALRGFQTRDLLHLASIPHGANFSVPGAGKTAVTLALSILVHEPEQVLFVVGPKASFPAWTSVVNEFVDRNVRRAMADQFILLDGDANENEALLAQKASRVLMSYDLMVRQQSMLTAFFSRNRVHLVLDESHRMKAGMSSQRGTFLLSISHLLARRDILTGTPMPQGPGDLASQLKFLWPGLGYDLQIQRGVSPRSVLGRLYVRTTKSELKLPKVNRYFRDIPMTPGQTALYGLVRNETVRQLASAIHRNSESIDFLGARRSVMRLLQLSSNPILALKGITRSFAGIQSGVIEAVVDEGPSSKMRAVMDHVRELKEEGKKVVIWTIFTETILELEAQLADLNPVTIYGAIPSGSKDDATTREGKLKRFHEDPACFVLIANPAAAGEGISLHTICHNAIYLDRSYVSTHYLQSIDRIHRLGLDPNAETNIFIYRTKAPAEIGSIDYSVSRRLAKKIRGLQELLNDTDLHEIAFDEENADDPVDYSVELQDIVDLISELEGRRAPSQDDEEL